MARRTTAPSAAPGARKGVSVQLNTAQQVAVDHDLGPLLVLAGAGSGKTGVVTQRIAKLISRGVPARAILAMTFTNKAAMEMQQRVVRLTGRKASKGLFCGTFHRFGLEVLSRETKALGFRGQRFAIFDRGDCSGLVREALRPLRTGRNWDVGAILHRISLAKNGFFTPEAYANKVNKSSDPYDEITSLVYPIYEQRLSGLQAFDFDDLVCAPVWLWRRRQDVLERWRMRYRYIIIDEYQDTNHAQLELLRNLAQEHRNICVVGDDDQAIYAWRGADVRNILDFEKHFAGAKVVRLEHNYRSREPVLNVANAVLQSSRAKRHKKKLIPTRGSGNKAKLISICDGETEARYVCDQINKLITTGAARAKDIAILYRSNLQAGDMEAELKAHGVPFRVFGGTQTFDRKEVKDVLAYLSVAVDRYNELAIRRAINYPARGIGEAALRKLSSHASAHDRSLWSAVERPHAVVGLPPAAREGCRTFVRIVQQVRAAIDERRGVVAAVRQLVEEIELKKNLWAEAGQNNKAAGRRWNNVQFLLRVLERREEKGKLDRDGTRTLLNMLMLRETDKEEKASDAVTLTTMHGAKGLEFPHVFLVGLEEGLLPHARTTDERATDARPLDGRESDDIEQERRLFYVAVTRAREQLYLCYAKARPARGKLLKRVPSRFLLDLPEELFERIDINEPPPPDADQVQRGAQDVLAALLAG